MDEGKSFDCDICGNVFESIDSVKSHIEIDHGMFQCIVCGSVLFSKESLNEHSESKHGEKIHIEGRKTSKEIFIFASLSIISPIKVLLFRLTLMKNYQIEFDSKLFFEIFLPLKKQKYQHWFMRKRSY